MVQDRTVCQTRGLLVAEAMAIATAFLRRWRDALTESLREDISQQAALAAADRLHTLRRIGSFPAFVRTIARRKRAQAVRDGIRNRARSIEADVRIAEQIVSPEPDGREYRVADTWIARRDLLHALPEVLAELPPINTQLLLSYYEGFSCLELAERFGLTVDGVKVRIYRSRRRVRRLLECRVITETGELRPGVFPDGSGARTDRRRKK